MFVTNDKETKHISIDEQALKQFLRDEKFSEAFIDELDIFVVNHASEDDMDDSEYLKHCSGFEVWLFARDKTQEQINEQILAGVRYEALEQDQEEAAEQCWKNWHIDPLDLTGEVIEANVKAFVEQHKDKMFVLVSVPA